MHHFHSRISWCIHSRRVSKQQYSLYLSDEEVSGRGPHVLNDKRFSTLRSLERKIFTVPASSAGSERVSWQSWFNYASDTLTAVEGQFVKTCIPEL